MRVFRERERFDTYSYTSQSLTYGIMRRGDLAPKNLLAIFVVSIS
jgi:hypothetical protein